MHTTVDFGTMLQIELLRQQHDERMRLDDLRRRCMANLGRSLRDAAMLTSAFRLGDIYGWSMAWNDLENGRQETDEWRPGCGWTAGSKLTKGGSP